jgi:hypothetical protein
MWAHKEIIVMRLLGFFLITTALIFTLSLLLPDAYGRGRNNLGRAKEQTMRNGQEGQRRSQSNQKSRRGNGNSDRKRLRDGSCVNPSLYGK